MNKKIINAIEPEIDKTIVALKGKKFRSDPLVPEKFSRITSVLSSAYKRHGFILERAILEATKENPSFVVWEDNSFQVSNAADHMVDSFLDEPAHAHNAELPYLAGHRTLQVDLICYNKESNHIASYEIKRGNGLHDAGKRRSILRDLLCQQVLLKSYAKEKGFEPVSASSRIIFYYGQCSLPKPYSLVREELDEHFNWPIVEQVELVNKIFSEKLIAMLE